MEVIKELDQLFDILKKKEKKRLVAMYANDSHTIEAVGEAVELGLVAGILVGDKNKIIQECKNLGIDPSKFNIIDEPNELRAANKSVQMIQDGEGDLIMKGLISTDKYMRAILNKENGLLPPGGILTHISVLKPVGYHKMLVVGDVAIIPNPELKEKIAIAKYLIKTSKALGVEKPKLAVLAATELVLPKMQACVDAAILSKMGDRGQIPGAMIEGPMALDVAVDRESAEIKKISSPVAGDVDCLLFPNIESGNIFYKFHTKLSGGDIGAIVAGAKVPAILSSRGDSVKTKLYSIALAALMA
ncbi:MAG: phosphate acyltransferase [Bacteroidales bacterium]|nr:phosphate acyltransferase [Bacteroidales bacterium]